MEKENNKSRTRSRGLRKRTIIALCAGVAAAAILAHAALSGGNPLVGKWKWSYDSDILMVKGSVSYTFTREGYFFYESQATLKGEDMTASISGTYKTENGYLELDGEVARFTSGGMPGQAETPPESVDVFKYQVTGDTLILSADNRELRLEKEKK